MEKISKAVIIFSIPVGCASGWDSILTPIIGIGWSGIISVGIFFLMTYLCYNESKHWSRKELEY